MLNEGILDLKVGRRRTMATKCKALTSKGKPCLAFARLGEELCIFHSRVDADGAQRAAKPLTKDDLVKMVEQTIRQVRHAKLNAIERSRELRALIAERDKLLTPETPEPRRTGCNMYQ